MGYDGLWMGNRRRMGLDDDDFRQPRLDLDSCYPRPFDCLADKTNPKVKI